MVKKFVSAVAIFMAALTFTALPKQAEAAIFNSLAALEASEQYALDATFSSVGFLTGFHPNGDGREKLAGSAILIDPYWLLTAGHVPMLGPDSYFESMQFRTGSNVYQSDPIGVTAAYTFPGYYRGLPAGHGDDIGLLRLAEPIFDIQPATRFRGEDELGIVASMAGYGMPGVYPNYGTAFDGIKRAGQNVVESYGYTSLGVHWEDQFMISHFSITTSSALPLEWHASNYDSGGGWFTDIDGEMQLVGIHSFSNASRSGALRVSLYNDWIDQTIAAHPPAAVPEPGSLLLFSLGAAGLGAQRLRKRKAIA